MICRRRLSRNPLSIFAILITFTIICIFLRKRDLPFSSFANIKHDNSKAFITNVKHESVDADSQSEVERLKELDVGRQQSTDKLSFELIRKYNESLAAQEEENDPFKVNTKNNLVDFINFKTDFKETNYTANDLKFTIDDLNSRQIMYNIDEYPNLPDSYPVIVVQVHKRVEYFKELLDSLQRTRGIENALLVISHDYYTDAMNALIRMIKFCRVIQIFFPFSQQLYPDTFPGPSKDDCPRDANKEQAVEMGCINAEHPDKYGHYREAHITMTKHHWWWKINVVFDKLLATKDHHGPVMFIEEDHYVVPSFYEALMKLHEFKHTDPRCKDSCEILTLGTYNNKENYQFEGSKVLLGSWVSTQHNMGMAMYRSTWEKIKKCANEFCTFDDYNWDWTLMYLSRSCIGKFLSVLVYEVPRMFHVGDCGLHHTKSCNSKDTLNKVKAIIERNKDFMFTDKLNIVAQSSLPGGQNPNGGWGDVRDHELCLRFVTADQSVMRR